MLDYNTLNSLVEAFNKNGISNVKLENGSTLEIKEGQLLINGEPLSIDIGVINTDNITGLSTETIEGLKAGDLVLKHTGNQIHAYKVTYKEEHQGICISYYDAGYTETVSYDYVDGAWVYNSTDVINVKEYSAGTGIQINDNNEIINTQPNKQLYNYIIQVRDTNLVVDINIVTTVNKLPGATDLLKTYIKNLLKGLTDSLNPYMTVAGIGRTVVGGQYYEIKYIELIPTTNSVDVRGFYYNNTTDSAVNITTSIGNLVNNSKYWVTVHEL